MEPPVADESSAAELEDALTAAVAATGEPGCEASPPVVVGETVMGRTHRVDRRDLASSGVGLYVA